MLLIILSSYREVSKGKLRYLIVNLNCHQLTEWQLVAMEEAIL